MMTVESTPYLDRIRPCVLNALRVRGWTYEPSQFGGLFRVRARIRTGEDAKTGTPRHALAVLEFREDGSWSSEGHAADEAVHALRQEGVRL